ncbi:uncharacterized protein [Temnothorax longispinosus]|uniref:uncharacterized protein n=1 Tax=Temnothorax longispinosus TaxID=300112 RepID=UPI003A98EE21
MICFTKENESWKVLLTNLIEIWTETLTDETILSKCQVFNSSQVPHIHYIHILHVQITIFYTLTSVNHIKEKYRLKFILQIARILHIFTINLFLTLEAFDCKQLVLDMLNDIPQHVHTSVLGVTAYRIELRRDKDFIKLRFLLDLLKGTPQQFWENVTMPHCLSSIELLCRHKILLVFFQQSSNFKNK